MPVAAVAAAVCLVACAAPHHPVHDTRDIESGSNDLVTLAVEVTTDNHWLAGRRDDGTCVWHTPAYVLRDGAGTVLDVGDVPADRADGTAAGEILDGDLCLLPVNLDAPPAEVYEVEITATAPTGGSIGPIPGEGESYSGSDMISRRNAQDGGVVEVFIAGPPSPY
ncbi:hypothetical protein [Nocardiopsis algeriensis]|uniref:Secreted protein n=1 Tax=Nocardiopsis algeriensis TaxID=1478215 RepID=A0A841IVH6_9ACTN|nr:hypothetical protein [Nocardiopsis algeriensis]MBB6120535.1 hypothetical protein [Nocardiopsis algeriensis]